MFSDNFMLSQETTNLSQKQTGYIDLQSLVDAKYERILKVNVHEQSSQKITISMQKVSDMFQN